MPAKKPVLLEGAEGIDQIQGTMPREDGDVCIASYMNFLIVNGGVIVPQYGDENDGAALAQIREMFPDREVVGVRTKGSRIRRRKHPLHHTAAAKVGK